MKVKAILLVLCIIVVSPAFGEELTNEKKDEIKNLMEITGATEIGEMFSRTIIQKMTELLKKTNPNTTTKAFTIVEEEVNALIKEEMIVKGSFYEKIYPIYHKYLTLNDIRELIDFYKSPVGEKIITVLPILTQESIIAGQSWGQHLGPLIQERIIKRFEKEGISLSGENAQE